MKTQIALIAIASTITFSCNKLRIAKGTPACVNSKITDLKENGCRTGAEVKKHEFQGATVYTYDPGICGGDLTTEVTDENCTTLGYLGGIIGNTKINGEEFSNAKFTKTVWSN